MSRTAATLLVCCSLITSELDAQVTALSIDQRTAIDSLSTAYLTDFDAARKAAPTADALVAATDQQYSSRAVHDILVYSARKACSN
jgi:hypothetical protein